MTDDLTCDDPHTKDDIYWMNWACSLVQSATKLDEVPVAAIIVQNGRILTTAFNLRETLKDPMAHCEILALKRASEQLGRWRLFDCDLYVTLEPCIMCAGALIQARVRRVVYGASDPKGGALGSLYALQNDSRLNHKLQVTSGVLEESCSQVLKDFFKGKRKNKADH